MLENSTCVFSKKAVNHFPSQKIKNMLGLHFFPEHFKILTHLMESTLKGLLVATGQQNGFLMPHKSIQNISLIRAAFL
jgi:hypothetical protein